MGDRMTVVPVIVGILILGTLMSTQETFSTSFPGENGKIAFRSTQDGNAEIYIMDLDGTNQQRLTQSNAFDDRPRISPDGNKIVWESNGRIIVMNIDGTGKKVIFNDGTFSARPTWSPDGLKISFFHNGEISVMDSDGTNLEEITNGYRGQGRHSWSPDGSKIVFDGSPGGIGTQIFVMNSDGTNIQQLTNVQGFNGRPSWSPDGSKIIFDRSIGQHDIFVINSNGSGEQKLTFGGSFDGSAKFSPDGKKITFISDRDGKSNVFVMNSDGTQQTNLRNTLNSVDGFPDWQPLVNNPPICEDVTPNTTNSISSFASGVVITSSSSTPVLKIESSPSHKTVEIGLSGVTDPDGDPTTLIIDGITQDEPTTGSGKGDKSPDGFGIGTDSALVRAERLGTGDGRVYEISFTADDGNGGMCSGSVFVAVPHDNKKDPIDSGQNFDSTLP